MNTPKRTESQHRSFSQGLWGSLWAFPGSILAYAGFLFTQSEWLFNYVLPRRLVPWPLSDVAPAYLLQALMIVGSWFALRNKEEKRQGFIMGLLVILLLDIALYLVIGFIHP